MMRALFIATGVAATAVVGVSAATAASCSHWRKVCQSRAGGPACDAKFAKCMKDGSWHEGENWGGKTHTGLTRK
jgi:hypothetical protein